MKKLGVTGIKWNPRYYDLFALSFGSCKCRRPSRSGIISLSNEEEQLKFSLSYTNICSWLPESTFKGVLLPVVFEKSINPRIHQLHSKWSHDARFPSDKAVLDCCRYEWWYGSCVRLSHPKWTTDVREQSCWKQARRNCVAGTLFCWYISSILSPPIYTFPRWCANCDFCHHRVQVLWGEDLAEGEPTFYSISSDGNVFNWTLMQNQLIKTLVISLVDPQNSIAEK